jgi:hypothetical protein
MNTRRTPAYWLARALLAVAILLTVLAVTLGASLLGVSQQFSGGAGPRLLGVPFRILEGVLTIGLATLGLAWTFRIFLGSRDEPPPWRHRDR